MFGLFEVFVLFCAVCYLFNKARAEDMVDVISNQVSDLINAIPRFSNIINNNQQRLTTFELRRFATEKLRQKSIIKEQEKQAIENKLYNLKETQAPTLSLTPSPLSGLACQHCAPSHSQKQIDPKEKNRDVIDILRVTKYTGIQSNDSFFNWTSWFPFLAQCLCLQRYPYPQVSETVLKDERLQHAIEHSVKKTVEERKNQASTDSEFDEDECYEKVLKEHEKRAKHILIEMRSKISDVLLRITCWVLYKLLPCFMSGVVAQPAHIDMLKRVAKKAPGVPLIFLPLHRSHLDYILVSFILLNNDIRAPIVAAGDNLRIPFFGALLRGLGAFFIKRKIDPIAGKKDIVYRAILQTYMQHALAAGHNVEFFIEGGRTRTGKPCMPKAGVLSVIIDAFMDGTISDALLVPVSVNYEKLVDGNFVYEQLGQKKKPESFKSAVAAIWHILNSQYGQMRIDFNEPFSVSELVKAFNKSPLNEINDRTQKLMKQYGNNTPMRRLQHQPSTSSLFGTDIVQEEHRALVDSIARHVVYDCVSATAVMSTNALAFLLLTRFRDGATISVLAEELDNLRSSLHSERNIGFTGDSQDVIEYAAALLGPTMIVQERRAGQKFYRPIMDTPNVIELSYYSNSLVAHYALDSIFITTIHNMCKQFEKTNPNQEFKAKKSDLFKACIEHCDILRYEFIFNKPCQSLDNLLEDTFERLVHNELISVPTESVTQDLLWSKRYARDLDDSDEEDRIEVEVANITLPSAGHCERIVLMSVVAPLSHTYLAVANSLYTLLDNSILESEFIKTCVKEITSKVDNLECKYGESVSTDTIRNCIKMLEKLNAVEITNTTGVRLISLGRTFDSSEGVQNLIHKIQSIIPI